ncbi:hypothetical protein CO2235_U850047 [Cupriavidus oxalaticus]|uniref:Uncharacterized protein n=1 Tax=Cupriavidus oxalaticus TaxID=96344 RepID=A0A375FNJ7_9BURK|nr:hypothetical protein CO2235_U850047 [Cupriavidus oxalaticus]
MQIYFCFFLFLPEPKDLDRIITFR